MIIPGDLILIPGKNPDRTGNKPTLFRVLNAKKCYDLEVEYVDGQSNCRRTSFLIPEERAERYKVQPPEACKHEFWITKNGRRICEDCKEFIGMNPSWDPS